MVGLILYGRDNDMEDPAWEKGQWFGERETKQKVRFWEG